MEPTEKNKWEASAKEIKDSFDKDTTPKQIKDQADREQRDKKGRAEEDANLARRVQRESDLQKKEARTPHHHHRCILRVL